MKREDERKEEKRGVQENKFGYVQSYRAATPQIRRWKKAERSQHAGAQKKKQKHRKEGKAAADLGWVRGR